MFLKKLNFWTDYLSWIFNHVGKRLDKKEKVNFKNCHVKNWATSNTYIFFSIWTTFQEYSRLTGQLRKWKAISLTPFYHLHPLHRHLDISRVITAESSPLHITSSRTRIGNLWFPSASRYLVSQEVKSRQLNISRNKINQKLKFVQLIEYDMRSIFLEKPVPDHFIKN